jgi:hypothetical protein
MIWCGGNRGKRPPFDLTPPGSYQVLECRAADPHADIPRGTTSAVLKRCADFSP